MKRWFGEWKRFFQEESGVGVVEIIDPCGAGWTCSDI